AAIRVPVEMPGAVAEGDPQLADRRLWREHELQFLAEQHRERALRHGDLGEIGIDLLEGAVDARVGVVQDLSVDFLFHHRGCHRGSAVQKSYPARRTSTGTLSPFLNAPRAVPKSLGVRTPAEPTRRMMSPVLRPAWAAAPRSAILLIVMPRPPGSEAARA